MKTCSCCRESKELSQFSKNKAQKDGLANQCKSCFAVSAAKWRTANKDKIQARTKNYWAKTRKNVMATKYKAAPHVFRSRALEVKYGITLTEYNQLLALQKDVCAICKNPETTVRLGKLQPLAVDHDHATGKVRGLLCTNCNNGLGRFKDSDLNLMRAIVYLTDSAGK